MEDKKITCKDCGKEFIFTVGEQEFYKEKGFENDPVRCPECRKARKAQKMNRERNTRQKAAPRLLFSIIYLNH